MERVLDRAVAYKFLEGCKQPKCRLKYKNVQLTSKRNSDFPNLANLKLEIVEVPSL